MLLRQRGCAVAIAVDTGFSTQRKILVLSKGLDSPFSSNVSRHHLHLQTLLPRPDKAVVKLMQFAVCRIS